MKVVTPAVAWHDRQRVAAIDFQPCPWPLPSEDMHKKVVEGQRREKSIRVATGGDDKHVVVRNQD